MTPHSPLAPASNTRTPARTRVLSLLAAVLLTAQLSIAADDPPQVDPPQPGEPVETKPVDPKPNEPAPDEPKPEDVKPEEKPADPSVDKSAEKPTEKPLGKYSNPATPPVPKADVPDSPAKAILRRSAEAVKAAKSISFKVKLFGEGGMLGGAPALEANVKMLKAPGNANAWLIRAIGTGANVTSARDGEAKGADPAAFDVVWTATTTSWVEHADKMVYTRPVNAARSKSSQAASSAKLRYFNLPSPFQKELLPADFTQEDAATVNGEMCDITSTKGDRGSHDRYSIGQKDGFPRRIEKIFDTDRVRGRYVTEFTDVKIDEEIAEAYFKIPVPDGYKENIQENPKPVNTDDPAKVDAAKTNPDGTPPPSDTTIAAVPPPVVPVVDSAPDIDLPLNSGTIKMSSLKGNVVVLDFFGTWALTSKGAHEELKKSFDKFKDKPVRFLSFAVREKNPDAATEYLTHNQFAWDLAKRGDSVGSAFNVKTYPFWIVVDQEGKIKYRGLGSKTEGSAKLDDAINEALGIEKAPATDPAADTTKGAAAVVPAIPAANPPATPDSTSSTGEVKK